MSDRLSERQRMIRDGLLVGVPIALTFSGLDLIYGLRLLGIGEMFTAGLLAFVAWKIHRGRETAALERLVVTCAGLIFLLAFVQGGIVGIGFLWSIGFPVVATFLLGSREGWLWTLGYPAMALAVWGLAAREGAAVPYAPMQLVYMLAAYGFFALFSRFLTRTIEREEQALAGAVRRARQAAEEAAVAEANQRAILETIPDAVGVHRDGRWVYLNPAAVRLFGASGPEELVGRSVMDFIHPDSRDLVRQRIREQAASGKGVPPVEERLLRLDGTAFDAVVQASPLRFDGERAFLAVCRDITEQKRLAREKSELQAQLVHAQRLESLGLLAGGIAHDFNNLLTAIQGNCELALVEVSGGGPVADHLGQAMAACDRAAMLCRQLLAYAGKGSFAFQVLNPGEMVESMVDMLRASVRRKIRLHVRVEPDLPRIQGDPAQLQQVLLNFVVNASDAIGDASGDIHVRLRLRSLGRRELDRFLHGARLEPGDYLSLEVEDTGCGMDEATLARIFDPFYTTKEDGTGLGLSAVVGIVQRHEGAIRVRSQPGKGSTFEVLLPVAQTPESPIRAGEPSAKPLESTGKVLIVDDEPEIRRLAGMMLERMGFETLDAPDGERGLALFRERHRGLSFVLMDMTMPAMDGIEAMRRMRAINPDVPVILASGYSTRSIDDLPAEERPAAFVQKPYRMRELTEAVRAVLSS